MQKEFYFMAQAYLFVHFREKTTPDGEQVYFGVSRDGFFQLQRKITIGSKTMTGRITDTNKIAVRLIKFSYSFSYKKNCGRLPFGKFLPQFFFAFLFRQNPSASFLFWRTVPFLQIGKCIVLMVSEFFFISVPVQRFLHGTCGRRQSARSASSGCRK